MLCPELSWVLQFSKTETIQQHTDGSKWIQIETLEKKIALTNRAYNTLSLSLWFVFFALEFFKEEENVLRSDSLWSLLRLQSLSLSLCYRFFLSSQTISFFNLKRKNEEENSIVELYECFGSIFFKSFIETAKSQTFIPNVSCPVCLLSTLYNFLPLAFDFDRSVDRSATETRLCQQEKRLHLFET